jgi:predicted aldo/keto reductase-like oxidoreductase
MQYAASNNIAVMVMEPLRGGMLAGKLPKDIEEIYRCAKTKRSAAEWALRWVWNHPEVTVVLSGMNDEKHIAENIRTCETALPGSMTADDLATVEAVAASYNRQIKVGCTGCAYCMPCPFGVNIPQNFFIYNSYFMGNKLMSRGFYGLTLMGGMGERADAALCKNCGKCAKACPQKIAIPDELGKVRKILGGLPTKIMIPLAKMMFSAEVKE